jgi:hypothetical protein
VFGKTRPGVSLEAAQSEMAGIGERLAAEHPETNQGVVPEVSRFTDQFLGPESAARSTRCSRRSGSCS